MAVKPGGNYALYSSMFTHKGERGYQEDRAVVVDNFNKHIPPAMADKGTRRAFYAVFDGHGGARASEYLFEHFHVALGKNKNIVSDPKQAIAEVWDQMENEMIKIFRKRWKDKLAEAKKAGTEVKDEKKKFPRDGSTAVICLIVNNDVYFANVGDSLAVLFYKHSSKKPYTTFADVHDPVGPERERIEGSGGEVKDFTREERQFPMFWKKKTVKVGKPRAYPGGLLVSRAFGDFHGKLEEIGGIKNGIIHNYSEIRQTTIDSDWENLVVASDGIWDPFNKTTKKINATLNDQFNAIELFGTDGTSPPHNKNKFKAAVECICMDAVEHKYWLEVSGLEGNGADNTTAIVIRIGKPS